MLAIFTDLTVLGHRVFAKGLEVNKVKIDVIANLPPPTNVKGIRTFLGHASFYRRFKKYFLKSIDPICFAWKR